VVEGAATGNREAKYKTEIEVSEMMRIKDSFQKVRWWTVVRLMSVALFLLWTFSFTWVLLAEPPGQRTFASAAQASRALFLAAQAGDERALLQIFTRESKGRVAGPFGAAVKLGIPRQTLESKIVNLGINKNRFKSA
jgi:transcriptional regulator with GAF, ATPase, and Fis domain